MEFATGGMHERGQALSIRRCMVVSGDDSFARRELAHKFRSYGADTGREQKAGEIELLFRRYSIKNHPFASRY